MGSETVTADVGSKCGEPRSFDGVVFLTVGSNRVRAIASSIAGLGSLRATMSG